jgi:hypothetical protein
VLTISIAYHIYNWQADTQNLLSVYNRAAGLAIRAFTHTARGYALDTKSNTPLSKVYLPPRPHVGRADVFIHSTPLTLSPSLWVKGLTRMCYGWNNKSYMLTLNHLNNQCGANPTTSLPLLGLLGPNHNNYRLLTGCGVTVVLPPLMTEQGLPAISAMV